MLVCETMSSKPGSFLKTATAYGFIAFLIGFLFGATREMSLIPLFGETAGELIEFPFVTLSIVAVG